MSAPIAPQIAEDGFVLTRSAVDRGVIDALKAVFANSTLDRSERGGETYGARNLLGISQVKACASSPSLRSCLSPMFGKDFRAVRAIFFDKTEKANWPVPWHQDLSIAVRERRELAGWTNWTVKRGVVHVQAPERLLERMVTARIHLDDCTAENGPLRVIPGSHRHGRIRQEDVTRIVREGNEWIVTADAGDVLLMKPLLLHASSPARTAGHRRVLHLEFAPAGLLPHELQWADFGAAGDYSAASASCGAA